MTMNFSVNLLDSAFLNLGGVMQGRIAMTDQMNRSLVVSLLTGE